MADDKKKNGTVEKSPRKGKKLRVWQDGKAFDFGDSSMEDYRQHKDKDRKKAWYARHKKNLEGNSPRARAFRKFASVAWQDGGSFTEDDNTDKVKQQVAPDKRRLMDSVEQTQYEPTDNIEELYKNINTAAYEVAKNKKDISDFYAGERGHFNKEIIGNPENHLRDLEQSLYEKERVRDSLRQRAGELEKMQLKEYGDGGYKKYQPGGTYPPNDPPFSTQNPYLITPSVTGGYDINTPSTDYRGVTPAPTTQQGQRKKIQPTRDPVKSVISDDLEARHQENLKAGPTLGSLEDEPGRKITKANTEYTEENQRQPENVTFNPYAGVDIPSAASFLGESIESGNVGMGVASGAKLGLGLARNVLGGMGRERVRQNTMDQYRENQRDKMEGPISYNEDGGYYEMGGIMPNPMQSAYQGMSIYEDGGEELPQERIMTGEVMQGVSENNKSVEQNSELENGEYIHSQDGSSIKVEGKDHEEGGEIMELQDGDKIISNNLKLKGQNAKALNKEFDTKFSAKDTYAKAVDKIYSSIGLSKVIKEEENILKKLQKIEDETKDETTKNLNAEFLYKKLEDIQKKKNELEPLRQQALSTVFDLQEQSKPKEEQSEEETFEDGGIKELSLKYGIPEERAKQIIEEFKKGGYYKDGGDFQERLKKALESAGYSGEELLGQSESMKDIPEGQSKKILEDLGIEVYGDVGAKGVLETVTRNPWYDWNSFDGSEESVEDFQKTYNEKVEVGNRLEVDGKFGEQTQSAYIPFLEKPEEDISDVDATTQEGQDSSTQSNTETAGTQQRDVNVDIPMTPDQGVIPPSAMASQLDVTRRYDRINPELTSAEAIIAENQRQAKAAIESASDLPDSQRASTIAQINSNLEAANQKAIAQTEMQNAQIRNQAQAQNIQIQANEENARAKDALNYEQRQQTAEALTEENVRQFYDYLRKLNASNFNDTRRRNTLNQMYENFDIDSMGNVTKRGQGASKEDLMQTYNLARTGVVPQTQAKYGGKYKNKK